MLCTNIGKEISTRDGTMKKKRIEKMYKTRIEEKHKMEDRSRLVARRNSLKVHRHPHQNLTSLTLQ